MNNEEFCKYFLQGKCEFGRFCRFPHPTISNGGLTNSCGNLTDSNGCLTNTVERSVGAGECSTSANQYLTSFDEHSIDTNAHHHSSRYDSAPGNSNNSAQLAMTPEFIPSFQLSAEKDFNNGASNVVLNNSNEINSVKQLRTYDEVIAETTENGEIVKNADQEQRKQHIRECLEMHQRGLNLPFKMAQSREKPNGICYDTILHTTDRTQRDTNKKDQRDMNLSFQKAKSSEKTCGICLEEIMGKPRGERMFGILPECSHAFCLNCIRKWRQTRDLEDKVVRSCPECRTKSNFVCPSVFWVDSKEDKDKLIASYKSALGKKHCKYFKRGEGECPFGNKCFYKHALPNGELVDVGSPRLAEENRWEFFG